jgi:thioesterase domain-containing protein
MHDPIDDWRRLARGGVVVVDVPGEHFGLLEMPAVQVLAERLAAHLRETMRPRP